ncbi:HipA N-terminal domain-containing protein [Flectobacillus longus]|jgi:serine/threonine-protein kinase HipA|uniref:HipA N-terminal domain-containing protein n=1 Tax=Flectobacillus longus TaxID=2984207 RepID=A0ABT6YT51_9BACT|nr:HipA N-terminal domain-containing protein [Flectobacillus longus]MDI9866783.1 HipA N-terminal domain-containing protein [Flectobacillus longus]MDI9881061.1 HipA N-terminal domain-containing protein [Flectobacillus longus]
MRQAQVFYKNQQAGFLTHEDNGSFTFCYLDTWFANPSKPSVSLTLPKTSQCYTSEVLFPFFYNMLPEGVNKQVVCQLMRIDSDDYFGLLLITARHDSIGAVTVQELPSN